MGITGTVSGLSPLMQAMTLSYAFILLMDTSNLLTVKNLSPEDPAFGFPRGHL
jgi:hypothetical protein